MAFSKEVGEVELIDDFHPIATAIVGKVGSRALHSEIKTLVGGPRPEDFEQGTIIGETTANPTTYVIDVESANRTSWQPDAEVRWEYLEFEDGDPEPLDLTVPLMIQPRLSEVPELEDIETVSESEVEIMRRFSQEDRVHPAVVTICLDELPSGFEITDFTLVD